MDDKNLVFWNSGIKNQIKILNKLEKKASTQKEAIIIHQVIMDYEKLLKDLGQLSKLFGL